jgi:hypothetical protein
MALGVITVVKRSGDAASAPLRIDSIQFAGDSAYPAGGSAGLEALLAAKLGVTPEIVAVIPGHCGQYIPSWDITNKKLFVRDSQDIKTPWGEVGPAPFDLSGTTFNIAVISK